MKPVTVSVTVPNSREEVFDFLDELPNHERFCDHFLTDWTYSGPRSGVGARARFTANTTGSIKDWIELEVVESERPARTVEQSVAAKGKRKSRGTYTLDELPDGAGTRIVFEFSAVETPFSERLFAPLVRSWLRRNNRKALTRLSGLLAGEGA